MLEAIKIQICIDQSSLPEFLARPMCAVPPETWFGAFVALIAIGFILLTVIGGIIQAVEKKKAAETPMDRWKRRG